MKPNTFEIDVHNNISIESIQLKIILNSTPNAFQLNSN